MPPESSSQHIHHSGRATSPRRHSEPSESILLPKGGRFRACLLSYSVGHSGGSAKLLQIAYHEKFWT